MKRQQVQGWVLDQNRVLAAPELLQLCMKWLQHQDKTRVSGRTPHLWDGSAAHMNGRDTEKRVAT